MIYFLSLALALTSSLAQASPQIGSESRSVEALCAQRAIAAYRSVIDQPQYNDKFKHCAMSCILTLHCGRIEAGAAGLLKEFLDIFNHGDPDIQDWRADKKGIALVTHGVAKSPQECFSASHALFDF